MAELIEVLRGEFVPSIMGNPLAASNYQSFVANNAVTEVQCDAVTAPLYSFVFCGSNGRYKFAAQDHVIILSAWLSLPYHYVLSRPNARVQFVRGNATAIGNLIQIAPPFGHVHFPAAGAEVALGVFCPFVAGLGAWMAYGANLRDGWVSQIGAPAALNGTRFYPSFAIKVLHNLELLP